MHTCIKRKVGASNPVVGLVPRDNIFSLDVWYTYTLYIDITYTYTLYIQMYQKKCIKVVASNPVVGLGAKRQFSLNVWNMCISEYILYTYKNKFA